MKNLIKVLIRYVASAAGVALVLLLLNLAVLAAWMVQASSNTNREYHISAIADALTEKNGNFTLSPFGENAVSRWYQWAMLLDDNGTVVWSKNLPDDVRGSYTVPEVASFTRWYLNDYPVYVWRHPQGLLVLGSPKGSIWKQQIQTSETVIANIPAWLISAMILNCIAAVLLALLLGIRLLGNLRPIIKGIEDVAERQPVELSTGGLLGDLASKLNQTSMQLQKQESALQKRDNARTAWIAGVSHDIRTPLSIVMGYASQLEDNPQLPGSSREQAQAIRIQSEKIKTLVNDLNLASKLEYNMQPLSMSTFHPAALVRTIVTDFLNSGLDCRYSIDVNVEDNMESAVLTGDEELLQRAVSNLIANSITHNPDGCAVRVTVERRTSHCLIIVSDNGTGFPLEVLKSLKAPDNPTQLKTHGLGLTIVRQIMRVHGGMAEFKNLSEGCMVSLFLSQFHNKKA